MTSADEQATRSIAVLVAQEGIEQVELTGPWKALVEGGWDPVLIAPDAGEVQAFEHLDRADTFPVDRTVADVTVGGFAGLLLPGGVANPDALRTDTAAVDLVREFVEGGRPVAAICHAIWMLVEADVVRGRTVTSWPSLQTDVRNAGGTWVDQEVVTDGSLVTSRKPDDLPGFNAVVLDVLAAVG
ncbi:type 1 glutamine amidotransferase [Janibacter sp. CX7]|uniref:type 1 glutamine amidotransferase domain-containing protein n=1 Tax=Janibacter sp. CX7 TaxID=2963431 RepID=UPI0020CEC1E6|nr:type 1 glutamine amidotransferase domain-containing protein [Janibacter sp. CX7]UTT67556.1 type 1 glutamine amidotransferase [Janibacter sp. CX7]